MLSNYTWFDTFKETIYYKFIQPIKILQETIVRIVKWLPILIKDRNWDWVFILIILQTKIRFTRECIDKYGNEEKYSKRKKLNHMRTAELLLQRLQDSNKYVEQEYKEHRLKYPIKEPTFDGKYYILDAPSEEECKDFKVIMNKEKYMWDNDFDYLCKILKKHIQSFWD